MKRKRLVAERKVVGKNKRITNFVTSLRKRFKELEKEEEEFRILALKKISLSSKKTF